MKLRPTRTPAHLRTRSERVAAAAGGVWDVLSWGFLLVAFVVIGSRIVGGIAPVPLQPFQATLPVFLLPAWIIAFVSVFLRRWPLTVAAVFVAVVHVASIAPARATVSAPFWLPKSTSFTLLSANVAEWNATPANALDSVAQARLPGGAATPDDAATPDVVLLHEVTPDYARLLDEDARFADYAYRVVQPERGSNGVAVLSKFPFDDRQTVGSMDHPAVRVLLPDGQRVRIAAVHLAAPLDDGGSRSWDRDLKAYKRFSQGPAGDEPLVLAGDFNATRWQPPFGALLAGPLQDVHELQGKGLTFSWPTNLAIPPVMRLDHALVNPSVYPTALRDFEIAGSDHAGFIVRLAVRTVAPPGPEGETITEGTEPG